MKNLYIHPTKKKIIKIATTLFSKKGFSETSIAEIIKKTKLSKGAVYYHFKSKEEIADFIIQEFIDKLLEKYNKIVVDDISALEKFKKLITEKQVLIKDIKGVLSGIMDTRDLKLRSKIQKLNQKYFSPILIAILKQGKREKVFKIGDPYITTLLIMSLQESFYFLPQGVSKNEELLASYFNESVSVMSKILGIKEKDII